MRKRGGRRDRARSLFGAPGRADRVPVRVGQGRARDLRRSVRAAGAGSALVVLGLAAVLATGNAAPAAAQTMDDHLYWMVLADELEYAPGPDERPVALDASFWIGGDFTRFYLEVEGERATEGATWELEAEALYSRLVAPFWEARVGVGVETVDGGSGSRTRGLLVLEMEGLAPYWFELEPRLAVSHEGDVALALEASYELLFTQRLILEPELEASLAFTDAPDFGVESGLDELSLGGRLRYEIVRELAPYVGLVWSREEGEPGVSPDSGAEEHGGWTLVAGMRVWY